MVSQVLISTGTPGQHTGQCMQQKPPKKGDTAVDEAHSQQLTEEARKMHLKNGMACGSQLVTFSLFV